MPSIERRRHRRGIARPTRTVLVAGAVLVLLVAALVGGALRAGSQSSAYQRAIDRSYAAQMRPIVAQSNVLDHQVRAMLAGVSRDSRMVLEATLDTLVRSAASLANRAETAASPAPSAGAGGDVARAMAQRARAMVMLRSAVNRLLGMAPLPVVGSPGPSSARTSLPALSSAGAADLLARAGALLQASDRSYASGRRALRAAPGKAALPPSVWAAGTVAWTSSSALALVDELEGSPTLAPVHRVALVAHALALTPAPVPPAAPTQGGTAVTLPPTGRIVVTAVVANHGDVFERGIVVRAEVRPSGAGAPRVRSARITLAARSSESQVLPALPVVPGRSYTVTVTVTPPVANTAGTVTADTISIRVAPPSTATVGQLYPSKGRGSGGTSVTILGSGFTWVRAVVFGAAKARFKVISSTQIIAVAPPGTGTVTVRVDNAGGPSPASPGDRFTYRKL